MDGRLIDMFEESLKSSSTPSKRSLKIKKEKILEIKQESTDNNSEDDDNDNASTMDESTLDSTDNKKVESVSSGKESKKKIKQEFKDIVNKNRRLTHDDEDDSTTRDSKSRSCSPVISNPKAVKPLDIDTNSSSSEDQPLSRKNMQTLSQGTKRKAEVLSKESGKIGVTIKTSSTPSEPQRDGPTQAKVLCSEKSNDTSQKSIKSSSKTNSSSNGVAAAGVGACVGTGGGGSTGGGNSGGGVQAPTINITNKQQQAPLSPETPASRPESNIPASGKTSAVVPVQPDVQQRQQQPPTSQQVVETTKDIPVNNNNTIQTATPITYSPKSAQPRLWLPKKRVTEQVFITDVTVNLETVTIRECKTERGFFRERDLKSDVAN